MAKSLRISLSFMTVGPGSLMIILTIKGQSLHALVLSQILTLISTQQYELQNSKKEK